MLQVAPQSNFTSSGGKVPLNLCLDIDRTLIYASFEARDIAFYDQHPELHHRMRKLCIVDCFYDNQGQTLEPGKGIKQYFIIALRPHLQEFTEYILKNVDKVHIWSAGLKRYVRAIESVIFPFSFQESIDSKIDRVYSRYDCQDYYYAANKSFQIKDIEVFFNLQNTLIVDDNCLTFYKNPHNAIYIPEYEPKFTVEHLLREDDCLLKIIRWLEACKGINSDVRQIDKRIYTHKEYTSKQLSTNPDLYKHLILAN